MHLSDDATILTLNSCPILIPVPGKHKVDFFLNTHYIVNEKHIYSILRALAAMKPSFGRWHAVESDCHPLNSFFMYNYSSTGMVCYLFFFMKG